MINLALQQEIKTTISHTSKYLTEDIITLTTALCFINNEANAPELINNLRLSVAYDMG